MKKYLFLIIIGFFFIQNAFAQEQQILKLTPEQVETVFLRQNLELIAEQMNIDLADAEIVQAKLWDNPELSISSVNLWSTENQRKELEMGSFPKNTQFSIALSQLIQTANKRGKLINREKVSREITVREFEEVLRGLKVELRKLIHEMEYLQSYQQILYNQQRSLEQLIAAYSKQVLQGNIAKSELLRLQSSSLELENEKNELQTDLNAQQKELKSLLNVDPFVWIEIEKDSKELINPDHLSLANLLEQATESRPDLKRQQLQVRYYEKALTYEKSQRIPDMTLNADYDRQGGVWKDFVGFGVSFDLPFLNRNQGNIKAAKINRDRSEYLARQQQNKAQHEVVEAFSNYVQAYRFYKKTHENELLTELDSMLDIYTKNLLNKNISMLEYIDFMNAYKSNKQTVFHSAKNLQILFEELQYTIGTDIK
ncbi:TolC family protein [Parabacteroides sp. Marseille-P3160]|uniref:TolC family protein n=1 Tax=Parabacteroides sp. Marseille-P3160 TaxID=1917887 RepID=UPI0009B95A2D|nr:TolC family protein [Parabacteroides sp. Marseille-P3160]